MTSGSTVYAPYEQFLKPAIGIGGALASQFSWGARQERKDLRDMWKRYKAGNLGPSAAQKAGMLAESAQRINAQNSNTQADLARQSAAAGGAQSGAIFKAQMGAQKAAAGALGQAQGQVEQIAGQQAAQQEASLHGRMTRQRGENRAFWQQMTGKSPYEQSTGTELGAVSADLIEARRRRAAESAARV